MQSRITPRTPVSINEAAAEARQEHAATTALGLFPRVPCLAAALVLDLITAHRTLLNWSVRGVDRVHGLCDGAAGVVGGHLLSLFLAEGSVRNAVCHKGSKKARGARVAGLRNAALWPRVSERAITTLMCARTP